MQAKNKNMLRPAAPADDIPWESLMPSKNGNNGANRKQRDVYPDSANLRRRLLLLIHERGGSVEDFALRAGISVAALRSYLEGSRSPSAPVLYKLWRKLNVSPSYLIAGVGPQNLLPTEPLLSTFSPSVCAHAQIGAYTTNARIDYAISERGQRLSVTWRFPNPRGARHATPWPGEAGVMAIFARDQFPRGCDWSAHEGIVVEARTNSRRGAVGVKIRTGAGPGSRADAGVVFEVGRTETRQRIHFKSLRAIEPRFDPRHVRTLALASTRDLAGATKLSVHFTVLEFIR
jgi:transcriptional regulator with XRE-family HTH domain